jgi:F-type H+-transporting ATPase subunit b
VHIDPWTLALQTANFLILVWLLQHFLYRPLRAVIRQRQEAADRLLAEAEAARQAAEAQQAELARARAAAESERLALLAKAADEAEGQRREVLAHAGEEADRLRSRLREELARERADTVKRLGADAAGLAVALTRRLLARAGPQDDAPLIEETLRQLAGLPADQRARLRGVVGDPAPEVVTARPLPAPLAARLTAALDALFGRPAGPRFRVDPDLLAGIELQLPGWLLRNSWSGDLAVLGEALTAERAGADA